MTPPQSQPDPTPKGSASSGATRRSGGWSAPVAGFDLSRVDRRQLIPLLHARHAESAARRRRRLIALGIAMSALVHVTVLVWLAGMLRPGYGPDARAASVSVAAVASEDTTLTDVSDSPSESAVTDVSIEVPTARDLEASEISGDTLVASSTVTAPSLGGAGAGASSGGGMGGSGTSFFGISSSGSRFAYIVDRSGSMQADGRWDYARAELVRSVRLLPDHAMFHAVLFSSGIMAPPQQRGWLAARARLVRGVERWLSGIGADGGTQPAPAFKAVFELPRRPDVIFFLTDGEIPGGTAELVRELNDRGRKVVINTIAFGDPASQEQLEQIARESGGRYTFFKSGRLP